MFESIMNNASAQLTYESAILCMITALILGIANALLHTRNKKYTKNFVMVVALLPLVVQVIVIMVNGNLGTSVAILGAFSLIKFRSVPASSKELMSIFISMAIGLATGMGHILFSVVFMLVIIMAEMILSKTLFIEAKVESKILRILIPDDLNYDDVFKKILLKYTVSNTLDKVKTTNMGSMYELTYSVILKDDSDIRQLINEIRCRNGNLTVAIYKKEEDINEL